MISARKALSLRRLNRCRTGTIVMTSASLQAGLGPGAGRDHHLLTQVGCVKDPGQFLVVDHAAAVVAAW